MVPKTKSLRESTPMDSTDMARYANLARLATAARAATLLAPPAPSSPAPPSTLVPSVGISPSMSAPGSASGILSTSADAQKHKKATAAAPPSPPVLAPTPVVDTEDAEKRAKKRKHKEAKMKQAAESAQTSPHTPLSPATPAAATAKPLHTVVTSGKDKGKGKEREVDSETELNDKTTRKMARKQARKQLRKAEGAEAKRVAKEVAQRAANSETQIAHHAAEHKEQASEKHKFAAQAAAQAARFAVEKSIMDKEKTGTEETAISKRGRKERKKLRRRLMDEAKHAGAPRPSLEEPKRSTKRKRADSPPLPTPPVASTSSAIFSNHAPSPAKKKKRTHPALAAAAPSYSADPTPVPSASSSSTSSTKRKKKKKKSRLGNSRASTAQPSSSPSSASPDAAGVPALATAAPSPPLASALLASSSLATAQMTSVSREARPIAAAPPPRAAVHVPTSLNLTPAQRVSLAKRVPLVLAALNLPEAGDEADTDDSDAGVWPLHMPTSALDPLFVLWRVIWSWGPPSEPAGPAALGDFAPSATSRDGVISQPDGDAVVAAPVVQATTTKVQLAAANATSKKRKADSETAIPPPRKRPRARLQQREKAALALLHVKTNGAASHSEVSGVQTSDESAAVSVGDESLVVVDAAASRLPAAQLPEELSAIVIDRAILATKESFEQDDEDNVDELEGATQIHYPWVPVVNGDVDSDESDEKTEDVEVDELEGATQLEVTPPPPRVQETTPSMSSSAVVATSLLSGQAMSRQSTPSSLEDDEALQLSLARHASPVRLAQPLPALFPFAFPYTSQQDTTELLDTPATSTSSALADPDSTQPAAFKPSQAESLPPLPRASQKPLSDSREVPPRVTPDSSSSSSDSDSDDSDSEPQAHATQRARGGRKSLSALTDEAFRRPIKPRASLPVPLPHASLPKDNQASAAESELARFLEEAKRPRISASQLMLMAVDDDNASSSSSSHFSSIAESRESTPKLLKSVKKHWVSSDDEVYDDNETDVAPPVRAVSVEKPVAENDVEGHGLSPAIILRRDASRDPEDKPEEDKDDPVPSATSVPPGSPASAVSSRSKEVIGALLGLSGIDAMPSSVTSPIESKSFSASRLLSPYSDAQRLQSSPFPLESQYAPPTKISGPLFFDDSQETQDIPTQRPNSHPINPEPPVSSPETAAGLPKIIEPELSNDAEISVVEETDAVSDAPSSPRSNAAMDKGLMPAGRLTRSQARESRSPSPHFTRAASVPVAPPAGRSSRTSASQPSAVPEAKLKPSVRAASQSNVTKRRSNAATPARPSLRASSMRSLSQLDEGSTPRKRRTNGSSEALSQQTARQSASRKAWVANLDDDDDDDDDESDDEKDQDTRKAVW